MSDSSKKLTLEHIRDRLASMTGTKEMTTPARPAEPEIPSSPYIDAAAVMVFFNPDTIQPIIPVESESEITKLKSVLIGCSEFITETGDYEPDEAEVSQSSEVKRAYNLHFSLRDDVRKATLRKLVKEKLIQKALDANRKFTLESANPLQRMFTKCLLHTRPDINSMNLEELNAFFRVSCWLEGGEGFGNIPSRQEIIDRIEVVEMLTPMKHLTGVYEGGTFHVLFRGRREELSTLRSYVGIAPPRGIVENINRAIETIKAPVFSNEKKPLLIFGIGGVGKSTLLAKFILEHMEAHKLDRFPYVYLDFDRPNLSALEPETLLIEAARQLAIQYRDFADLSKDFMAFHHKWNEIYSSLTDSTSTEYINLRSVEATQQKELDRNEIQPEFLSLIKRLASYESRPFLVILDTFEEVQYKGPEYVKTSYEFLKKLQAEYPMLRTIIAGRAPVSDIDTYKIELSDLDREAAQGYLIKAGITDPTVAKNIAVQIGGNPLTLKLAAEFVKKLGDKELKKVKVTKKQYGVWTTRINELELQGVLYNRILEHLNNKEIQKLAHPGLILRKISAELILKVLAGPCELSVTTMPEAQELFDLIAKEVSLVTPEGPGALRHRPDVRKVMLKLVKKGKEDVVKEIHRLAVEYYRDKESLPDRAEEMYHLLAMGTSPRILDKKWEEGMQNYLLGSVDELPVKAQAFLLAKTGRESSDLSIWEQADMEDQNRRIAKQAANLLNSGLALNALQILDQPLTEKGQEVLAVLKAQALSHLHRYEEAKEVAQLALKSYYATEFPLTVITALQRFANMETQIVPEPDYYQNIRSSRKGPEGYGSNMETFSV